jgi:DNA polymerase III delta prime subunit
MDSLIESRGRLYAAKTFANYETKTLAQRKVVKALREYADDFPNRLEAGQNVVLVGTSGTGKDHLLMALAHEIFEKHGIPAHWEQGVRLLEEIRNSDFGRTQRPTWNGKSLSESDIDKIKAIGVPAECFYFESSNPSKQHPMCKKHSKHYPQQRSHNFEPCRRAWQQRQQQPMQQQRPMFDWGQRDAVRSVVLVNRLSAVSLPVHWDQQSLMLSAVLVEQSQAVRAPLPLRVLVSDCLAPSQQREQR